MSKIKALSFKSIGILLSIAAMLFGADLVPFLDRAFQRTSAQSSPTFTVVSTNAVPGSFIEIPIDLTSSGGITGFTFSLSFDTSALTISGGSGFGANPDVIMGAGAPQGTSKTVNSEPSTGRIGVFISSPTPFPSGTAQVLRFRFQVLPGAPIGFTPVAFSDQPIQRSTSASGTAILASYTTGSVNIVSTAGGVEGDIDGDTLVTVLDEQLLLAFRRGAQCPPVSTHQAADVGPRVDANNNLVRGDGQLGTSDDAVMAQYISRVPGSPSDFTPSGTDGYQLTPAGGPSSITNLTCTPGLFPFETGAFRFASYMPEFPEITSFRLVPVSGARGSSVDMLVEMTSDGVEAGTQFSIHFDPAVASVSAASGFGPNANPDVAFGDGVAQETTNISVNAFDAANGNMGLAFNFNARNEGTAIAQGTRNIARITFHLKNDAPFGDSPVTFTSTPLVRVTSTLAGAAKTTNYTSGALTVAAPTGPTFAVGGKVVSPSGAPVRARIILTDTATGEQKVVFTSPLGFFTFSNVPGGKTYKVNATSKRYRFAEKTLTNLSSDATEVNFSGRE